MTTTDTSSRAQLVELTAERDAPRAQLEGDLPKATRWLQSKVLRQAEALDALNRRVVTQRFVLRTLDRLEVRREDDRFFVYERAYGTFSRSFVLPVGADVSRISADLRDGVLHITVPKRAEMQARRIEVGGEGTGAREIGTGQPEQQKEQGAKEGAAQKPPSTPFGVSTQIPVFAMLPLLNDMIQPWYGCTSQCEAHTMISCPLG